MKRLIPQSLFGRTIAVLIVGLIVTHFASSAIHYSDRGTALTMVGGGVVAERIVTMVPWLVHVASRPGFRLSWDPRPALSADASGGLRESVMAAMLSLSLSSLGAQDVRVGVAEALPGAASDPKMPRGRAGRGAPPPGMGSMMRYHMQMMERFPDEYERRVVGFFDGVWGVIRDRGLGIGQGSRARG